MHIYPFRALYPIFERISSPDEFCANAKHAFLDYQRNQLLTQVEREAVFIYQIQTAHRTHAGIIAANDLDDLLKGKVKKHERTLSEREQQQQELLLRWGAILKPVLLTFPPVPELNAWMQHFIETHTPLFTVHFADEHQTHRVWAVYAPEDIAHLQQLFARQVPNVYIADGHHRTSTMALLRQQQEKYPEMDFGRLFSAYFATDQLDILDYNRVVEGLNGLQPEQFFRHLGHLCTIQYLEHPRKPRHKYEIKMFFREHWYRLQWRPELLQHAQRNNPLPALLDVSLLNEFILHRLLGIQDVRTDTRITYVEGSKGLKGIRKAIGQHPERIGFVLYPVSFDDMMRIADAGETLPPKSTYFEPRMKSATLIKPLRK
ncbi:MAG: DUF1015 family protein [Saprospiraceae bacterium]|nr:DUF1015 family protein [Saprospiraceae bacterium]MDW8228285.1 DUF1015 family protein [Saprospiraceae bacterium]